MKSSTPGEEFFDFVVIGSGFGGSVSAMRLTEKGYRVLVLERGRRYRDRDFPRTNWQLWNYLWMPRIGFRGFMQMSLLPGVFVLHGSGVGGGSLVYAGVLMEPEDAFYRSPTWSHLADWKAVLRPHYHTARRMLGVARNPKLWKADEALQRVAHELGQGESFRPTEVGVFFGEPGEEVPDPYFHGRGPPRAGCIHCGGCMVGCRHNAKNSLPKNYLYFAETGGAEIRPECRVDAIAPLAPNQEDGARFLIRHRPAFGWRRRSQLPIRAKNIIVAAGVLGTVRLLLRCRDELRTMPHLSARLGETVRTNSESFVGNWSRQAETDQSQGLAISSSIHADPSTRVEVVRFPEGSSFMYWLLGTPCVRPSRRLIGRLWNLIRGILRQPVDFLSSKFSRGIAGKSVALMIMQTEENKMRLRLDRRFPAIRRRTLIAEHDIEMRIPVNTTLGHRVVRSFSSIMGGMATVSISESLLGIPMTAHIMGGCVFGRDAGEGVIGIDCQAHNYPGLYIVDGSILPANPGINPSLTITALAEYAMDQIPAKEGR